MSESDSKSSDTIVIESGKDINTHPKNGKQEVTKNYNPCRWIREQAHRMDRRWEIINRQDRYIGSIRRIQPSPQYSWFGKVLKHFM